MNTKDGLVYDDRAFHIEHGSRQMSHALTLGAEKDPTSKWSNLCCHQKGGASLNDQHNLTKY